MNRIPSKCRRAALSFLLAGSLALGASAQSDNFPNRPLKLIIPYGAGSGVDLFGRVIAEKLRSRLGQPVVVENRPGAGTVSATDFVARQPPDGHTLLLTTSAISSAPATMANLPFDPLKDFSYVAPLAVMLISLTASKDLPASNVPELIAWMKANPGKLNYASHGMATTSAITFALFNQRAGVQGTHIPYKTGTQALADMMGGQVHAIFDSMATSGPLIKGGKLKALAVATSKRSTFLPDTPTVAEAGLPGFEFEPWYGLLGPAGMPRTIVDRLNRDVNAVMADPEVQDAMRKQYLIATPGSADALRELVRKDVSYWANSAKAAGVKPE